PSGSGLGHAAVVDALRGDAATALAPKHKRCGDHQGCGPRAAFRRLVHGYVQAPNRYRPALRVMTNAGILPPMSSAPRRPLPRAGEPGASSVAVNLAHPCTLLAAHHLVCATAGAPPVR